MRKSITLTGQEKEQQVVLDDNVCAGVLHLDEQRELNDRNQFEDDAKEWKATTRCMQS